MIARFIDENPLSRARDFRSTIRWGDGTRTAGEVDRRRDGSYVVSAAHRYRRGGERTITVLVKDDRGARLRVVTAAVVAR